MQWLSVAVCFYELCLFYELFVGTNWGVFETCWCKCVSYFGCNTFWIFIFSNYPNACLASICVTGKSCFLHSRNDLKLRCLLVLQEHKNQNILSLEGIDQGCPKTFLKEGQI